MRCGRMLLLFPSIAWGPSLCFMWSCGCILCSSLGRGACCMREREKNPQTKRLMILQWPLPVATSTWDPHLKTPNWVSTLNWLGFFMALPASWRPCPPQEVNSVSDVLIIDIWHFTLAGKVHVWVGTTCIHTIITISQITIYILMQWHVHGEEQSTTNLDYCLPLGRCRGSNYLFLWYIFNMHCGTGHRGKEKSTAVAAENPCSFVHHTIFIIYLTNSADRLTLKQ